MNSLKFQALLMKPFTKKVLLEMADKGKVLCFFFSPTTQLLETYGGKRFCAKSECGLLCTKRGEESGGPKHGIGKGKSYNGNYVENVPLSAKAVMLHTITWMLNQHSQRLWV